MSFLGPALPLRRNFETGYKLIDNYKDLVKQNFKNLVLTIPGERIMDPNFGVGLLKYLFEQNSPLLHDKIISRIQNQIKKYMSFVELENVHFNSLETDQNMDQHMLSVKIEYFIVPLGISDEVVITNTVD
jgi:uncharacterized protein|tara:strand:- start:9057 stop:9446 length:390 start_codon:yes stop_codon:yes gene_type:complete